MARCSPRRRRRRKASPTHLGLPQRPPQHRGKRRQQLPASGGRSCRHHQVWSVCDRWFTLHESMDAATLLQRCCKVAPLPRIPINARGRYRYRYRKRKKEKVRVCLNDTHFSMHTNQFVGASSIFSYSLMASAMRLSRSERR